ncbi:hypothetical protein BDR04DRAFT_1107786 [Suillus decipiens]|nr:hypothetical protein BDR04DRAFT_1107786 [Suillus decipiens]
MVPVPAFYNKLVISVHFQSFPIVTDTPFSIHRLRRHLFLPSSSHNRSAHPSPRTLIFFSTSSPHTLSYLQRILS